RLRPLKVPGIGPLDAQDDAGVLQRRRARADAGALGGIVGVGDRGARAGTLLDRHVGAERDQLPDGLGGRRDPALAGLGLLQDRDLHPPPPFRAQLAMMRTIRKAMMKPPIALYLISPVNRR